MGYFELAETRSLGSNFRQGVSTMHTAMLTFNARSGVLSGRIESKERPFHLHGESGGSRGHTSVTPAQARKYLHNESTTLESRLSTTQEIKDAKGRYVQRGGTLPKCLCI